MKCGKLLWVVPLVVAVASCSSDEGGASITPEALSEALPTIIEMPGEWDETQRQVFTSREAENPSIDPSVWCPGAATIGADIPVLAGQAGADVEMSGTTVAGAPRMMRLQAWTSATPSVFLDKVVAAVEACDGATWTDEFGTDASIRNLETVQSADQAIAWADSTMPSGEMGDKLTSFGRTLVARFGSVVVVLQLGEAVEAGQEATITDQDWQAIIDAAVKDLKTLDD